MAINSAEIITALRGLSEPDPASKKAGSDTDQLLNALLVKKIELQGLMPWSSNYTFLVSLTPPDVEDKLLAIYKPCQGERPLWDFPEGMLCRREFASYLISLVLGWPRIPPTVLRSDGPHGAGTIQLFIEADYDAHYFTLRENPALTDEFRRIALFDHIVNNADRKGGHCLLDAQEHIWAIDHGLTFHADYKLRTVIWEFCNEKLPTGLLDDLKNLRQLLEQPELGQILAQLISRAEIEAFKERIDVLLKRGFLPRLQYGRNIPYPPV